MNAERKRFAFRPGQDERRTAAFCVRGGTERTQNACVLCSGWHGTNAERQRSAFGLGLVLSHLFLACSRSIYLSLSFSLSVLLSLSLSLALSLCLAHGTAGLAQSEELPPPSLLHVYVSPLSFLREGRRP